MSRRTQIVLAITFMVAALVSLFSYIYVQQVLRQQIKAAHETAYFLASQLATLSAGAVPDLTSTRIDLDNQEQVRRKIAYYLSTDNDLNEIVGTVVGNFPTVYDASILDANGKAILHSNPDLIGKQIAERPDFQLLRNASFRQQLRMVYNPPTVYQVRLPVELNDYPFGSVRLGISTVYLKNELTPLLQRAVIFSGVAIFLSLFIAAGLSHLALGPLERLSRSIDSVSAGNPEVLTDQEPGSDEYGVVNLKIAHLGRQMRDVRQIFSALKDNVDQIMANLQDGLMLFTRDQRVVLVSASVERFLGRPRHEMLGRTVEEIFSPGSALERLVLDGFHSGQPVGQREVEASNGRCVQISLDFIQEHGTPIGALLTLRDAESVHRIEDEIELSRRMSASGRLTRGVAHEVKNPINAIVLHLQLLQNKLKQIDPDTRRHMDIIDSEIHRLDRVVQTLVDFTRPRDLHPEELDLRRLLEDVFMLASPDAEQHRVNMTRELPSEPLTVKVDLDFVKQALLNVVMNGVQAMPNGGMLTIGARRDQEFAVIEIRDQGVGIPRELQEKIFELYFTTKKDKGGSGIGLAQTYQIMQWHHGTVDFESIVGKGTTFRLCVPLLFPEETNGGAQSVPQVIGSRNG